jgi:hypothetical protein
VKPLGATFQTDKNTNTRNKRVHAIRCADRQNANCRCGYAKCYAFGAPDCIRKSLRPEINRYTKQFSTNMQTYRYHGDTDEAPTVDAGNLSVSLMVGPPAVGAVVTRARCRSSIPFDLRYPSLRSRASWSGCVQEQRTSQGLTPVAFRRRKGRIFGIRRQIGRPAKIRKLYVPFKVGTVSLFARKGIHASNCDFRNEPLTLEVGFFYELALVQFVQQTEKENFSKF